MADKGVIDRWDNDDEEFEFELGEEVEEAERKKQAEIDALKAGTQNE